MPWFEDDSYPSGWRFEPTGSVEQFQAVPPVEASPPAVTAGEQDHTNPWFFAGEEADAPTDTGRPA